MAWRATANFSCKPDFLTLAWDSTTSIALRWRSPRRRRILRGPRRSHLEEHRHATPATNRAGLDCDRLHDVRQRLGLLEVAEQLLLPDGLLLVLRAVVHVPVPPEPPVPPMGPAMPSTPTNPTPTPAPPSTTSVTPSSPNSVPQSVLEKPIISPTTPVPAPAAPANAPMTEPSVAAPATAPTTAKEPPSTEPAPAKAPPTTAKDRRRQRNPLLSRRRQRPPSQPIHLPSRPYRPSRPKRGRLRSRPLHPRRSQPPNRPRQVLLRALPKTNPDDPFAEPPSGPAKPPADANPAKSPAPPAETSKPAVKPSDVDPFSEPGKSTSAPKSAPATESKPIDDPFAQPGAEEDRFRAGCWKAVVGRRAAIRLWTDDTGDYKSTASSLRSAPHRCGSSRTRASTRPCRLTG